LTRCSPEAAQTSPLTVLAVAVDEDTTLEDHWAAASADIQGKVIAELTYVVVHPALRRERGASAPPDRDPLALTL
jgi:hypothetical protein